MGFPELLANADRATRRILGGSITYSPGSGVPAAVTGIFDAAYVIVDGPGNAGVSSSGPAVFLTVSDLPSDPTTDNAATVTVDGTVYRIREAKPDGLGAIILLLHAT